MRQARQAAGLSSEALAFRAHLSRNYISMLELDQKSPTLKSLLAICDALRVKAETLVARADHDQKIKRRGG